MKNSTTKILFLLIVIGWLISIQGCVDPYDQTFKTSNKIIIVEGILADDTNLRPITIKESLPSASSGSNINMINGAKVSIIVNGTTTINLTEKEAGSYYFEPSFKGVLGSTYQLKISTTDGNVFESKPEVLQNSVPISQISHQIDTKAFTDAKGNVSAGYKIYVDINDPASTANQYLWSWMLYEKQNVCQTCTGGYYYRTPLPYGACV